MPRLAALRLAAASSVVCMVASASARAQLGPPPVPVENPITAEKTVLGKILFWDEQLSSDNTMACGTCHRPFKGGADPRFTQTPGPDGRYYTDDDVYGSPGMIMSDSTGHYVPSTNFGLAPQITGRLAQTYLTASYFTVNFWDGRAPDAFTDPQTGNVVIATHGALESQLVNPPFATIEMADPGRTWNDVIAKITRVQPLALASHLPIDLTIALHAHPTYPSLFTYAFGDPAITSERIAFAIGTYERTVIPDDTPWDRYMNGDSSALDSSQQAGLALFTGKARCSLCHVPPLFSDGLFHNIGLRPPSEDPGLENVTGLYSDRGRFKTPSLRNAGSRRRWMHQGKFGDMQQIIDFYARGGDFSDNLDPLIQTFSITRHERDEIYNFITNGLADSRAVNEVPPFDRPQLHSESDPDPLVYGDSGAGSGGIVPTMIAVAPPNLGNLSFRVGVGDALGGAVACLAIASDPAQPGTTVNGVPVDIQVSPMPFLFATILAGAGPGAGYGSFVFSLPNSPTLEGQDWYGQWFVEDPAAAGGIASSQGAQFVLFTR